MRTFQILHIFALLALFIWIHPAATNGHPQQKDEVRRTLDKARRLERVNRYDEALQLHKRLFSSHPDNPQVLDGIERDLLYMKRYQELIDFLRELLQEKPEDRLLLEKLGTALYKSGQEEEAVEIWNNIIDQSPDNQAAYSGVARQYLYNGVIDKAIATYLLGREKLGNPSLFAKDLARLYESQMEYGEATQEYMCFLEENPKQYSYVDHMISRFKRSEDLDSDVAEVLERVVGDNPDNSQFRKLLGTHYLRTAQPDKAFEQFIRVDEIEDSKGGSLIDFADWSYREGFYSTALNGYEHISENYPKSPLKPKALQGTGRSLSKLGRYQEAIFAYRSLVAQYPKSKEKESALFEIGKLQLHQIGEVDSALSTFTNLVQTRKRGPHYFDAMYSIGECYLVKGDLNNAQQEYETIRKEAKASPEIAEEATFKTAEIKFFRGDFDAALDELETMTQSYPKGMFVNDALALMVFIEENRMTGDDALKAYAHAALRERQSGPHEAIEAYERILTYYPHSFLADDVLFKIGDLRDMEGSFETALETFENLITKYPASDLCDEAQRRIGEIYEFGLQDVPKAIEAYEEILSKYPESLLYDLVRKRIRELQGKTAAPG